MMKNNMEKTDYSVIIPISGSSSSSREDWQLFS